MARDVTILIPNYKTLALTRLCLKRLQQFTDLSRAMVIVIDNGSNDESTEYLRSLDWIDLIVRKDTNKEKGSVAHAKALDLAMERVQTPYLLSIHTDTFFIHKGWLDYLLSWFESESVGGVGSWKLEDKPWHKKFAKRIERWWQLNIWYPVLGKGEGHVEGIGKNYYYLRSHCAMYRMKAIRDVDGRFYDGGETAGKLLHKKIEEGGYSMVFLPSEDLSRYIIHLNHATSILNPKSEQHSNKHAGERKRILKMLAEEEQEEP